MTEEVKQEATPNLADAYSDKPVLNPELINKSLLERMPQPTGWRILILPYKGKAKTESGIFLPDEVQEKKQISINIETDTIAYFKALAKKVGIPYQNLINSYLTDCVNKKVEPKLQWG